MSALHVYVLKCNAPGCAARFARELSRADLTRQLAVSEGWCSGIVVRRTFGGPSPSLDYCPEHAALGADLAYKTLPEHARPVEGEADR